MARRPPIKSPNHDDVISFIEKSSRTTARSRISLAVRSQKIHILDGSFNGKGSPQLPHGPNSWPKTRVGSKVHIEHRFDELPIDLATNRVANRANVNPLNRQSRGRWSANRPLLSRRVLEKGRKKGQNRELTGIQIMREVIIPRCWCSCATNSPIVASIRSSLRMALRMPRWPWTFSGRSCMKSRSMMCRKMWPRKLNATSSIVSILVKSSWQ